MTRAVRCRQIGGNGPARRNDIESRVDGDGRDIVLPGPTKIPAELNRGIYDQSPGMIVIGDESNQTLTSFNKAAVNRRSFGALIDERRFLVKRTCGTPDRQPA